MFTRLVPSNFLPSVKVTVACTTTRFPTPFVSVSMDWMPTGGSASPWATFRRSATVAYSRPWIDTGLIRLFLSLVH